METKGTCVDEPFRVSSESYGPAGPPVLVSPRRCTAVNVASSSEARRDLYIAAVLEEQGRVALRQASRRTEMINGRPPRNTISTE